jgi:hypothetical protein
MTLDATSAPAEHKCAICATALWTHVEEEANLRNVTPEMAAFRNGSRFEARDNDGQLLLQFAYPKSRQLR